MKYIFLYFELHLASIEEGLNQDSVIFVIDISSIQDLKDEIIGPMEESIK